MKSVSPLMMNKWRRN